MKASILDLRRHMPEILRALDMNEQVTLTYRGREKGVIVPKKRTSKVASRQHPCFGMWSDRKNLKNVDTAVRRMRKGRIDAF